MNNSQIIVLKELQEKIQKNIESLTTQEDIDVVILPTNDFGIEVEGVYSIKNTKLRKLFSKELKKYRENQKLSIFLSWLRSRIASVSVKNSEEGIFHLIRCALYSSLDDDEGEAKNKTESKMEETTNLSYIIFRKHSKKIHPMYHFLCFVSGNQMVKIQLYHNYAYPQIEENKYSYQKLIWDFWNTNLRSLLSHLLNYEIQLIITWENSNKTTKKEKTSQQNTFQNGEQSDTALNSISPEILANVSEDPLVSSSLSSSELLSSSNDLISSYFDLFDENTNLIENYIPKIYVLHLGETTTSSPSSPYSSSYSSSKLTHNSQSKESHIQILSTTSSLSSLSSPPSSSLFSLSSTNSNSHQYLPDEWAEFISQFYRDRKISILYFFLPFVLIVCSILLDFLLYFDLVPDIFLINPRDIVFGFVSWIRDRFSFF